MMANHFKRSRGAQMNRCHWAWPIREVAKMGILKISPMQIMLAFMAPTSMFFPDTAQADYAWNSPSGGPYPSYVEACDANHATRAAIVPQYVGEQCGYAFFDWLTDSDGNPTHVDCKWVEFGSCDRQQGTSRSGSCELPSVYLEGGSCGAGYYVTNEYERDGCYEGNPCDVATGNKFEVEIDIPPDPLGLGFKRYYSSRGDNNGFVALGAGWRHSFARRMDAASAYDQQTLLGVKSKFYSTLEVACASGWTDIAPKALRGALASNSYPNYENGVCAIYKNGAVAARLTIKATASAPPPGPIHTVSRGDGTVYTFVQEGGDWVPTTGRGVALIATPDGWLFEDSDGTVERYDLGGTLVESTDTGGLTTSYEYSAEGRLQRVVGPTGRVLTVTYDANGRIDTVTAPDARSYSYSYDAEGNLASVLYPDDTPGDSMDNPSRIYLYEDTRFPHALTGITDENGVRFATWAYDDEGRAILSEHNGGAERVELTYNADGTTTVQDAQGQVKTYHFEVVHGVLKPVRIERQ